MTLYKPKALLSRIPAELVAHGSSKLPPPRADLQYPDLRVEIAVPDAGLVRIKYQLMRDGSQHAQVFWAASFAERVGYSGCAPCDEQARRSAP